MLRPQSFTKSKTQGFTLIEVLIAIAVLTVGLIGMAAMICASMVNGTNAKYMNTANVLASEKLDDLNKWPSNDPNLKPGGALTPPTTCAASDDYCDQVTVAQSSGATYITQFQKVYDPTTGQPTPVTSVIVHTSSGCVSFPSVCGVPNNPTGGFTFVRRWLITQDPSITSASGGSQQTITGAKQITVVVSMVPNGAANRPVSFQMSMLRP